MNKKFRHLNYEERLLIERHLKNKKSVIFIAQALCVSRQTIYNEIKKGVYNHLNYRTFLYNQAYSADIAQQYADSRKINHSSGTKIGNNQILKQQIEHLILKQKYSPYHTIIELNLNFSVQTLYRYIHKGEFKKLNSKHLKSKHKINPALYKTLPRYEGQSIAIRPKHIYNRQEYGHWEMDCVIGKNKNKKALLVFTERTSRAELIFPLKQKTSENVTKTLNKLLNTPYSSEVFKSITCDNGSEFSNYRGMSFDAQGEKRVQIYYCHPYCSSERGSNENANRLIRYFLPKGCNMDIVTTKDTKQIMHYINNLHRKIHNGKTASEVFNACSPIPIEYFYNIF